MNAERHREGEVRVANFEDRRTEEGASECCLRHRSLPIRPRGVPPTIVPHRRSRAKGDNSAREHVLDRCAVSLLRVRGEKGRE